jgi:hypothetical protein
MENNLYCDLLAEKISSDLFDGHLPPDPQAIVLGMVKAIVPMLPDATSEELESFANNLLVSLQRQVLWERMNARERINTWWIQ